MIKRWIKEARKAKANVVAFPELAVTGYPPEDLLLKPRFVSDNQRVLDEMSRECAGIVAVVGHVGQGSRLKHIRRRRRPWWRTDMSCTMRRRSCPNGGCLATYCKRLLPNYGVFDEGRYFHPGRTLPLITLRGMTLGVNICEDIWFPEGPTRTQALAGAEVIVNINASPFHMGKSRMREQMLATRARENGVIVTYTNTVGGQDELVFDGNSVIVDQNGEMIARAKAFEEDLIMADLNVRAVSRARLAQGRKKRCLLGWTAASVERITVKLRLKARRCAPVPALARRSEPLEEVYRALVLGVQDYVRKNGFKKVVIGLSGGVDSAFTAVIAVDALGAENVLGDLYALALYVAGKPRGCGRSRRRLGIADGDA